MALLVKLNYHYGPYLPGDVITVEDSLGLELISVKYAIDAGASNTGPTSQGKFLGTWDVGPPPVQLLQQPGDWGTTRDAGLWIVGADLLWHQADMEGEVDRANGAYTPMSHITSDVDPHGDRAYADAQRLVLANDPLGVGPICFPPGIAGSSQAWATASSWRYMRCWGAGTISKVGFRCVTGSGNIMVAAFRGAGSGDARYPAQLLAASPLTASPASGSYSEIGLGASLTVLGGANADFLGLWADNTTFAAEGFNGGTNNLPLGGSYGETTGSAPAVATPVATSAKIPMLRGRP